MTCTNEMAPRECVYSYHKDLFTINSVIEIYNDGVSYPFVANSISFFFFIPSFYTIPSYTIPIPLTVYHPNPIHPPKYFAPAKHTRRTQPTPKNHH